MTDYITIGSWNANGLKTKIPDVINFLQRQEIDILLIQETHLTNKDKLKLKNFQIQRQDGPNGHGGLVTLIKNHIPYLHKSLLPTTSLDATAITLTDDLTIINIYNSPRNKFTQQDLRTLLDTSHKVLLAGDFNARHSLWNCTRNNTNGNTLYSFIDLNDDVQLTYSPTHTHFPTNNSSPSTIDLVMYKNFTDITTPASIPELTSDHNPIILQIKHPNPKQTTIKRRSFQNTDWKAFRQTLNDLTEINNQINTTDDIDEAITTLTTAITQAMNRHSKLVKITDAKDKLPQDILDKIKRRNSLRKKYQRTQNIQFKRQYTDLCNEIRTDITHHRTQQWKNTLQSLNVQDNSLWKLTKRLKNTKTPIPTLQYNNTTYNTPKDKANILAQTYEKIHDLDLTNLTEEQEQITIDVRTFLEQTNENTIQIKRTNPTEIKNQIKKLPTDKAPGPDEIPNKILKNLPKKTIVQLNYIINAIFQNSYFPTTFKQAKIIPIPKPGKNKTDPLSYRPISLLNTLGKLTEKLIHTRLLKIIDRHQLIPDEQFGFRPGHSTTHQITRITTHIQTQNNHNKTTALCLLDFEKAFDKVWTDGLIYKMTKTEIPPSLIKLIHSYLSNRTFTVQIQNSQSLTKQVKAGVPQGSVLAPTLFSLYLADLPKFNQTNTALYADDTAIFASSFHAQVATTQIQIHLTTLLLPYFDKWKLTINATKTDLNIYTQKFTNNRITNPITINGHTTTPTNPIKYLGVYLDSRLSFNDHFKHVLQKAYGALRTTYPLLKSPHLDQKNKIIIYTQTIRPILTYASPTWCNASTTALKPLQRYQNKILRLITNSNRYRRINEMHEETNIPYITDYVRNNATKYYSNLSYHKNPLIKQITTIRHHNATHRLTHQLPYQNLQVFWDPP